MSQKAKQFNTRVQNKHATEADWAKSNLIPLAGELIVYDVDDTHSVPRFKVGDGIVEWNDSHTEYTVVGTKVNDLPFVEDNMVHNIKDAQNNSVYQINDGDSFVFFNELSEYKENNGQIEFHDGNKLGQFSAAFGGKSAATGKRAFAEGTTVWAKGNYSHAEGNKTLSEGVNSHAEGSMTYASGDTAHAEGSRTLASGIYSHSEGFQTKATGNKAHAEGEGSEATGEVSHAEGYLTKAKGAYSHAEGYHSQAIGPDSHAEGIASQAIGEGSHSEGSGTQAQGENSHAEGHNSQAIGGKSHAEGTDTIALGDSSHAEGLSTNAQGDYSHAEGVNSIANGQAAHAEGTSSANGASSHAEGMSLTGEHAQWAHAEGRSTANGTDAHSEGNQTVANGDAAHAEGYGTNAIGNYSHAAGTYTTANYEGQYVIGQYNKNKTETLFEIGNGTAYGANNAFEVYKDGHAEVQRQGNAENSVVIKKGLKTINGESIVGIGDIVIDKGIEPLMVEIDDNGYATHTPIQMLEHFQRGGDVYFQGCVLSQINENTAYFNYIYDDAIIGIYLVYEDRSYESYDYSIITNENFAGYMQECYGMSAQDDNHQVTFISRDLQMNNHAIIGLAYTNDEHDDSAVTVAYAKDNFVQKETDLDNAPSFGADDNGFYGKVYIATDNGDKTIPAFTRNDYDTLVVRGSDGNFQISNPTLAQHAATKQYVDDNFNAKQDALVSGENIKTINGESIIGAGNIEISINLDSLNIKNGTNYGLWQESEKDDTNITLKFTDVPLTPEERELFVKAYDRTQTGKTAVAFGSSVATGDRAFAAGSSNVAAGGKSIALGCDNYAGSNQAIALGYANYVGGGESAVALGHRNRATGAGALAANTEAEAVGDASVAMNTGTKALGKFSAAFGNQTIAEGDNQFVVGKFNEPNADTYFIIGNGNDNDTRQNAVEVYHNGIVRLPQNTYDNFIAEGDKITGSEIITVDILTRALEDIKIEGAVEQKTRAEVTNPYDYDYEQNSVPYLYGRYGDKNTGEEKEGLIKTSMGGIKNEIDNQIDIDFANGQLSEDEKNQYHSDIANGIIPTRYRNMLDVHTLPIRDGNCSVPVGMHTYDLDDNGNMINSKLWYGAAAPAMWVQGAANYGKLLPIRRGTTNPNHNGVTGWDTGVWQIPEEKYMTSGINIRSKNAKAADLIDEFKSDILKSSGLTKLNADEAQLIGALGQYSASFGGCSSAQGKRAFAEGTNTVAIGKYSHAEGDNSVTLGNDSHAEGYGTVAFGNASHAEGSGAVSFGMASHAGGSGSTAAGDASFAHGTDTRAYGTHSSAFGNGTIATRDNSFVIGKFNIESDDLIFGVGCGYDNSNRQNALALYAEDQGRTGLHVYGERVATENQVSELTEELRTEVKNNYGRKSVSGEILEIKDLDNPFNATVTSTVTDNYFYKKNYINGEARYPGSTDYEQPFNEPSVKLITQDGAQSEATITRSKYRDGFTQRTTAYIIFKTPNNAGQYTKVKLTFEGGSAFEIVTTLKQPLKDLHQYMLIINYGQEYYDEGMGSHIVDMTLTHLVDYEDSYHWIIGQDTAGIPCPYTIMIPHVGRIDKGDTLSIAYQCSEAAAALNNLIDSGSTLPDANDPDAPKFFVLI